MADTDPFRVFPFTDGAKQKFADPWALYRRLQKESGGKLAELHRRAWPEEVTLDARQEEMIAREPTEEAKQFLRDQFKGAAGEDQDAAVLEIVAVVRRAFPLSDLDPETGEGSTDTDCLDAYWAWLAWQAEKKAAQDPSPTSPPPSDSTESSASGPPS